MKSTKVFEKAIENYLKEFAKKDSLFQTKLDNPDKSIEKCCIYIMNKVKKLGVNVLHDQAVYDMAVHYYDEKNIKEGSAPNCKVIVPQTEELKVELSQSDLEEAKQKAIDAAVIEAKNKMLQKKTKTKSKPEETQGSLELF